MKIQVKKIISGAITPKQIHSFHLVKDNTDINWWNKSNKNLEKLHREEFLQNQKSTPGISIFSAAHCAWTKIKNQYWCIILMTIYGLDILLSIMKTVKSSNSNRFGKVEAHNATTFCMCLSPDRSL